MKTYLITDKHGRCKIGKSKIPELRLEQIQRHCPQRLTLFAVIDGDVEAQLHSQFADRRIRGEWFRTNDEILEAFCPGITAEPTEEERRHAMEKLSEAILRR